MDIHTLKQQQHKFYKGIGSIYCPILGEYVYFTGKGFRHLLYKPNKNPRNVNEQWLKLKCLEYVPSVIRYCTVISETRRSTKLINCKRITIIWYELVYKITERRTIRVIIERRNQGKYTFLSVMPHDKSSKVRRVKNKAPKKALYLC